LIGYVRFFIQWNSYYSHPCLCEACCVRQSHCIYMSWGMTKTFTLFLENYPWNKYQEAKPLYGHWIGVNKHLSMRLLKHDQRIDLWTNIATIINKYGKLMIISLSMGINCSLFVHVCGTKYWYQTQRTYPCLSCNHLPTSVCVFCGSI